MSKDTYIERHENIAYVMISLILTHYGIHGFTSEPLVSGLINKTWKITSGTEQYILQRVNDHVFRKPQELAANMRRIDNYLKEHDPAYVFIAPITNESGEELVYIRDDGYYRLFPFVQGSHTVNVVTSPDQAYEAALQFGKFTCLLAGFDAHSLHTTIPDFHNLTLRYQQFEDSVKYGNAGRVRQSEAAISAIRKHHDILNAFHNIQHNHAVRLRVTHHDTKISNVLFNDQGKGICVIDLDTVMPGFFISDVGDMMRTYLSPANEEEQNFDQIEVRDDFFKAIVQGYLSTMRDELTSSEKDLVFYAGTFLVYMQAIRFLADYCNNDVYYGANYETHNLMRATNQLQLLEKLEEKKSLLNEIILKELRGVN